MEGIKTGSAKVTVKLVDTLNPAVPATSESLMVVANLFLVPAVAYILPGAQLKVSWLLAWLFAWLHVYKSWLLGWLECTFLPNVIYFMK